MPFLDRLVLNIALKLVALSLEFIEGDAPAAAVGNAADVHIDDVACALMARGEAANLCLEVGMVELQRASFSIDALNGIT